MHKKKIIPFLLLLCFSVTVFSQTINLKKAVPPFNIELTNTKHLQPADLQKNMPVMLVYFSPTCEHCKTFTKNLLDSMEYFGNIQVVMISFMPVSDIAKFETEFALSKYPNVTAGSEGYTFTVQKFYGIRNFPFTALFNIKRELTAVYRNVPSIDQLIVEIKKMQ